MVVFDTIYHPENTMMLKLARERGCKTVTGVDMFLRQAAVQFKLYTGQDAPVDVMLDALKLKLSPLRQNDRRSRCRQLAPGQGLALVGYRGTGKSTVGRIARRPLEPDVSSTPISSSRRARAGRSRAIFAESGEPVFRDWEERTLAELLEQFPGGGRRHRRRGGAARAEPPPAPRVRLRRLADG